MERSVEIFAGVLSLVIGVSHAVQPRAWADFFVRLRAWGHAGVLVNGLLSLGFGAVVVAFHDVWSGVPAVLTVFGWAQLGKGFLCLVAPRVAMRSLERVSPERSREFVVGGALLLALSAACWVAALTR